MVDSPPSFADGFWFEKENRPCPRAVYLPSLAQLHAVVA